MIRTGEDDMGNVVRVLSAANRQVALGGAPLDPMLGLGGLDSAGRARALERTTI